MLLVIDAMIGQDAVKTSKAFHDRLGLTGVALTKLDGDARGGAALSVKEVTGTPVRFAGVGEQLDKFEEFRPEGMASRVLGMGDVVGLMKDFQEVVDEKEAAEKAMKMLEGQFSLDDFLEQVKMIQKMGSIKDLIAKMPGMGDMMPPGANIDDGELVRIEAIIQSFTRFERKDPYALIREPTRVERIAKGSGQPEQQVTELVQKFLFMKQMMEGLGTNMGMMGRVLRDEERRHGPAAEEDGAGRRLPRHGRDAWHGPAGDGLSWHGDARHGDAWHGDARRGR